MLKWTFVFAFSPDGQVICYSEGDEYDPFGFEDYDESDNDNVECTNGLEGLVSYISSVFFCSELGYWKIAWFYQNRKDMKPFHIEQS